MRRYLRHSSSIPIEFDIADMAKGGKECLNDISTGGLSFRARRAVAIGSYIDIRIPLVEPSFHVRGNVVWCRPRGIRYDVGIRFNTEETAFDARMVEQVCHIEDYKREILHSDGRKLTSEQAAFEWIRNYAKEFPELSDSTTA